MGWISRLRSAKKVMDTVPKVDKPWNLVLFIVNIILPGLFWQFSSHFIGIGTIVGGIMSKANGLTYLFGFLQLILSPILIGWIWSILWGYFMWDEKAMKKVVKKGVEVVSK